MMELTINGTVYQFNFGMGFLRELRKTETARQNGMNLSLEIGDTMTIGRVLNNDVIALEDVLDMANKGQNPRLSRRELEEYLENNERCNIREVMEMVKDFLRKNNATTMLCESIEEQEKKAKEQGKNTKGQKEEK
ncbi:MAG: tail assembly chaperone [Bilifractor sp.]|jgi:hypothetical protein